MASKDIPTPIEPDDRRTETRLSPGDVDCTVEDVQVVHVLGLSDAGHGMRLMTSTRLPADQAFAFRLCLDEQTSLELQGRVVWERHEDLEFTHRYISGIQFVDPTPAQCESVRAFLERFVAQEQHGEVANTQGGTGT